MAERKKRDEDEPRQKEPDEAWSRLGPAKPPPAGDEGWIPVDPKELARPVTPPPSKPAAKSIRAPGTVAPDAVDPTWNDPVTSPWAKPRDAPAAAQAPRRLTVGLGEEATTRCPRCSTAITYRRNGSPPWDVTCPGCGARGRLSK